MSTERIGKPGNSLPWTAEVMNEELTSNEEYDAQVSAVAKDIVYAPSTNIKNPSQIIGIKKQKLNPTPNLEATIKRKHKMDTEIISPTNIKVGDITTDNFLKEIAALKEENLKLRSLLNIESYKDNQTSEDNETFTSSISTMNRFDVLGNSQSSENSMEIEEDTNKQFTQILKEKNTKKKKVNAFSGNKNQNKQNQPSGSQMKTTRSESATNEGKYRRPPPINIFHQEPKDTWKLTKEQIPSANFQIKRINENKHILQMDNIANYKKIKEALLEAKTNFFSFTPKEDKINTYLIKGLDQSFEAHEVLEELKKQEIQDLTFQKVSRFSTKRATNENRILPIFMVQISANSNPNQLRKIRSLFHLIITWEKLKRKDIIQCTRCQRVGHAAANCNLKYRCVKCKEDHNPGECKAPITNAKDLYCINCNSTGHPASYRGCPKLIEYKNRITIKQSNIKQSKNNKLESINRMINPKLSFADVTKIKAYGSLNTQVQLDPQVTDNIRENQFNTNSNQLQTRLDKLENAIGLINNRLDSLNNLIEKILYTNAQTYGSI